MKHCPACDLDKDDTDFGKNRARKDGLQAHCRKCSKRLQHAWYVKNKGTHYANVKRNRHTMAVQIQTKIIEYLKTHPCVDCDETDPLLLDFDHVRGTKEYSIANRVKHGYGWERLQNEIEKCEIRCLNCHRRKTAKEQGSIRASLLGL